MNTINDWVQSFLKLDQNASESCYSLFETLLDSDDSTDQTVQVALVLHALRLACSAEKKARPFQFIQKQVTDANNCVRTLELITFRSTYSPGEWSRTFYEGLSRYPTAEFYGRRIVELGCGNGWICLGLALRTYPKLIVGVDINARAVLCARLNLLMNSYDAHGVALVDEEGLKLLDRVRFQESDLLEALTPEMRLDRVIGCIPQVLNPELTALKSILPSDEYLYSLSNYCPRQGYVEDEFGLGLIAKAIEQSIQLLRPTGKIILNLGGRPGEQVLLRLMTRRGLAVRKIWQTINKQDEDTSIQSLVEIEHETGHQFEFFMQPYASVPVSAATAQAYSQAGGTLYHSVCVYEASLRFPSQLKRLFKTLSKTNYPEVRAALDLSDADHDIAEERHAITPRLVEFIDAATCIPYGATAGTPQLRKRLAQFLTRYYFLQCHSEQLLIAPSRTAILSNLLQISQAPKILIDQELQELLPAEWSSRKLLGSTVIVAPTEQRLIEELISTLKPTVVLTKARREKSKSSDALEDLVAKCATSSTLLIIDISDIIEFSSTPTFPAALTCFSAGALPSNVMLLCGLIQNRVYPDWQLGALLCGSPQDAQLLTDAAEVSYSRTPILVQEYYSQLIEDLLYFHAPTEAPSNFSNTTTMPASFLSPHLPSHIKNAFAHPAITGNKLPFTSDSVRLDYGENELPCPSRLKSFTIEALVRERTTANMVDISETLGTLLEKRFDIPAEYNQDTLVASGVADLFATLVRTLKASNALVLFPEGAYGYFEAALIYYDIPFRRVPTSRKNDFKVTVADLEPHLGNCGQELWLYLNGPITNPTGALYQQAELLALVNACRQAGCSMIVDTIFSGLEFSGTPPTWSLQDIWQSVGLERSKFELLLLGGISKEYAAAGLRFAYMSSPKRAILRKIDQALDLRPHHTLQYAAQRLLDASNARDLDLNEDLEAQRNLLRQRALLMTEVLQTHGWEPLMPQGGLFLIATPIAFLGQQVHHPLTQAKITVDGDSIVELLFYTTGLCVNGSTWTGIPGFCRFVLATSETTFQKGLERIKHFRDEFAKLL